MTSLDLCSSELYLDIHVSFPVHTCTTIHQFLVIRARLHQDKVWEPRERAGCMRDVCVPDEPWVSLPVYLVVFTNKQMSSKSPLSTGAIFSITVCSDLFPFLASAVFFSLFICTLVNGIHFSMSALLHCSLLPARRLTHAVIHGRITGAASAFEASLLER